MTLTQIKTQTFKLTRTNDVESLEAWMIQNNPDCDLGYTLGNSKKKWAIALDYIEFVKSH